MAKAKQITLPAKFVPRLWDDMDQRCAIVRQIKQRYEDLKADAGVNSAQKDVLAQRATFLLVWLETQERRALEDGEFDPGPYAQSVNTLLGLLRSLGLEKARKDVGSLDAYVSAKEKV